MLMAHRVIDADFTICVLDCAAPENDLSQIADSITPDTYILYNKADKMSNPESPLPQSLAKNRHSIVSIHTGAGMAEFIDSITHLIKTRSVLYHLACACHYSYSTATRYPQMISRP